MIGRCSASNSKGAGVVAEGGIDGHGALQFREPFRAIRRVHFGSSVAVEGRSGLLEQGNAGGEAVDEVLAADGADLPHGEEAGDRDRAKELANDRNVVVGLGEEPGATAVASEQEGPADPATGSGPAVR